MLVGLKSRPHDLSGRLRPGHWAAFIEEIAIDWVTGRSSLVSFAFVLLGLRLRKVRHQVRLNVQSVWKAKA